MRHQRWNLQHVPATVPWLAPDRVRLINRLHMKGFCTESGFPREIPWLSTLEPSIIIERFNATIYGLCNYYAGRIRNFSHLSRWVYILRYSCLKTLAQKYRSSITKIFKKFGHNLGIKGRETVKFEISQFFKNQVWTKSWTLLTYSELKDTLEQKGQREQLRLVQRYLDKEKHGTIGGYPAKEGRLSKVTNEDYLEAISWASIRTQASFDLPCAICGSTTDIEMHHIRHVRKNSYNDIPSNLTYMQVLNLRNRKQVPLCRSCHMDVHEGSYSGNSLSTMARPTPLLYDNRIINLESYVHKGIIDNNYTKHLSERGWQPQTGPYSEQEGT